jgi:1-acyl-sn-glycerol-3-phosphate acyltransferase
MPAGGQVTTAATTPPAVAPARRLRLKGPFDRTPLLPTVILGLGRLIFSAAFRLRFHGLHHLPHRPYILVANHLGWLESLVFPSLLPRRPRLFLMGNQHNVVGTAAKRFWVRAHGGVVLVNLDAPVDRLAFDEALHVLRSGGALVIFAEGNTTGIEGQMLPFKDGAALLARRAGVPIVPCAIMGTSDLWLRKEIHFVLGAPIDPSTTHGEGRDGVAALTRRTQAAVADLMPTYIEPPGPKPLRKQLTGLL